ncbi:uncharacterized protein LOC115080968 [Rhinatrema bivittatum]|uniref:uncharacterized protein LOC115080968 n=1 Tax=Rhinatrema bivittatum TaxID=194408 RepID=UPI00112A4806|nr:uncharacterized protein LOC115080968 [Rhinatrema bivittatum]
MGCDCLVLFKKWCLPLAFILLLVTDVLFFGYTSSLLSKEFSLAYPISLAVVFHLLLILVSIIHFRDLKTKWKGGGKVRPIKSTEMIEDGVRDDDNWICDGNIWWVNGIYIIFLWTLFLYMVTLNFYSVLCFILTYKKPLETSTICTTASMVVSFIMLILFTIYMCVYADVLENKMRSIQQSSRLFHMNNCWSRTFQVTFLESNVQCMCVDEKDSSEVTRDPANNSTVQESSGTILENNSFQVTSLESNAQCMHVDEKDSSDVIRDLANVSALQEVICDPANVQESSEPFHKNTFFSQTFQVTSLESNVQCMCVDEKDSSDVIRDLANVSTVQESSGPSNKNNCLSQTFPVTSQESNAQCMHADEKDFSEVSTVQEVTHDPANVPTGHEMPETGTESPTRAMTMRM